MRLGWASRESKLAVLSEWVALVRRRLDLGASRASSCAGRLLQRRSSRSAAFVELSEAREQMHKNKFVVLDALYIAHILGRALVGPHVSDSRLGLDRPSPPQQSISILKTVEGGGGSGGGGSRESRG